jgi:CHAT domain-containing protein/Tfp pilus assembly protein PilF
MMRTQTKRCRVFLTSVILTLALLLTLGAARSALAAPRPQEGDDATLRVINESEEIICAVAVCSPDAQDVDDCALVAETKISPGESVTFTFTSGDYDVLLLDRDGNVLLDQRNIIISDLYDLRFTGADLCESLNQEGMTLYRQAKYQDAIQKFQEALTCYREANGRQGEGKALNNIGFIHESLGEYIKALDYYEQALTIRREIGDRKDIGESLHRVGAIYHHLGAYEEALDYYEQALTIRREIGDRRGIGEGLNNIGTVYESLGEYTKALDYQEQALTILREIGDRAGEGSSLNNIGTIYDSLGAYEEALNYYEQALTIFREVGDRKGEGSSLNNIGFIYESLGEYTKALDYYEQALTIRREIGDRVGEGGGLNNIGTIHESLGEYEAALDYFEQALTISREIGDRAREGAYLNNIGFVYSSFGEYEEALDYYRLALIISRETGDQAGEGSSLHNIGAIYHRLGEYEEALDYYEQALTIFREIDNRAREDNSLNNIGVIHESLGGYAEALDYYEQALTIRREIGDRRGTGESLHNLGFIHYHLGEYAEALDYYEQALTIRREIGDRRGIGESLHNLGFIHYHLGEYAEALDYYEQALTIRRKIGDRRGIGESLNNIGAIYESQEEYTKALDYYEQAMDVLGSVRAAAGSEASRASFIAQYAFLYDHTIDIHHAQGQDAAAFHTGERGRARAFLDTMATGHVQLYEDEDADQLAREQAAYAARRAAQVALAKARAQQPSDDDLIADLEAQLAEAEAEHAAALDAIESRGDQLAALVSGRSAVLDLDQVQALLDNNTTLLSYWVTEDQTLAFVVTKDSLKTATLPISRTTLSTQIRGFRSFANINVAQPENAVALYHTLIAPIEDHLTTSHLTIIPHNVLHYLPFAALTDGERYLVDDYTLSYLPSASVLPFIDAASEETAGSPLILGNPTTADYDASALVTERDELGPLPFAEEEAQAIARLYDTDALVREVATESIVREQAGASTLLHLAAHGVYNAVAPLQSLIALAPDDNAHDNRASDGWLTVSEVYGLDLEKADLVVLSACESQMGDLTAGDELIGLTRAFFFAGTPTVVASLWSVDDEATGLLMERFYTHLQAGMGKAEALRQAQIETREEYPNPYYWAAFVLSGDGGESTSPDSTETPTSSSQGEPGSGGLCPGVALPLALAAIVGLRRCRTKGTRSR